MTTRKIVVIIVSVVVVLGLVAVLVVGGIVGAVFYGISNSDAAGVAKEFLRNNEKLKQDIGEVKDFGSFITGNVNVTNGDGNAQLNLKVIGERKTVNATVELIFRSGHQWRVTAASYRNEAGETVDLLNPYETPQATSQTGKATYPPPPQARGLGKRKLARFTSNPSPLVVREHRASSISSVS
jgi:hypothetical protein